MPRSGGHRAEGKAFALQVLVRFDAGVGGDEGAGEYLVLLALYQWNGIASAQSRLNKSEAAQPGQIDVSRTQGFDYACVIGHWSESDRHLQQIGRASCRERVCQSV